MLRGCCCRITQPPTTPEIGDNIFRFKYFAPNFDFRTQWEYNNWMVATAGLVAATVANTTWAQVRVRR